MFFRRRVTVLVVAGLVVWLVITAIDSDTGDKTSVAAKDAAHHVTRVPRRAPPTQPGKLTASGGNSKGRAIDPAFFSRGACEEFAPTAGHRYQVVFLDAGHGGIDPGGVGTTQAGTTIHEAWETLPVELDTMALLRAQGFTVVVSRTADTTVIKLRPGDVANGALTLKGALDDVAARDVCANRAHANLLVGIYFDAGSSPSNAGCVTGYDTARPFAAANHRLADLVQHDVLHALNSHGWQIPDEGALPDTGLGSVPDADPSSRLEAEALDYDHLLLLGPAKAGYFSTPSQMPGVVVEPLYITDPFEGTIAASSVGQHAIASGIAQAVEQYFRTSGS